MHHQAEHLHSGESRWCLGFNNLCTNKGARVFFATASRLGDGAAWYTLMGLLIVLDGIDGLLASAHLAGTGMIALLVYKTLKRWTKRPRPFSSDQRIRAWVAPLDEFSFPSGHTLHAVAFSLVAVSHYPGLGWLLIPFTVVVAASRVALGLHYPSDVLAAILIGTALAATSLWLVPGVLPFSS